VIGVLLCIKFDTPGVLIIQVTLPGMEVQVISVKDSTVQIVHLQPGTWGALMVASEVYAYYDYECVVTSGHEQTAKHSYGSKHYDGAAFDLRTRHMATGDADRVSNDLSARLGLDYDVILENDHLHVEQHPRHRL